MSGLQYKGKEPVISIIVAIYNGEKYLEECLYSIVNQDYKNLQIILVDDGSIDRSGIIADKFALIDNRIQVIHQANLGVSASRNKALKKVQGEYVCIIDQDDIISINYISYLHGLCRDYDAEISLTPSVDKFFKKIKHKAKKIDRVKVLSPEEAVIEMLYHKIVISPWNKMFSRNLIVENNILFNPKYFNGEGFAFSIQCYMRAKRIAVGSCIVYHYRVGDPQSGASIFKEKYIRSSLDAQNYIKDTLTIYSDKVMRAWEFSNWHTHCDALNVMVGCGAEKYFPDLYINLKNVAQHESYLAFDAPVSLEQKMRGVIFKMSPFMASRIINKLRVRKFKKVCGGVVTKIFVFNRNDGMVVAA